MRAIIYEDSIRAQMLTCIILMNYSSNYVVQVFLYLLHRLQKC